MKLDFASCHTYIFSIRKTQDGVDETQLPFVSFIHLLHSETQDGVDETQLPFEFKVSFIHLLHPAK